MIEIDEEFKHLIPPLTTEEYKLLEEQCIKQGIRVPLTVWNTDGKTILIDGHNRYQIAQKHNLSYTTEEEHFESRNEAIVWICDNQLGRRNIHPLDGERLLNRKRKVLEEEAKKRQVRKPKSVVENLPKQNIERTRDIIGKELGVSGRQVDKLHRINEMASPQVKDMVRNGTLSVNQAYNTTFPKVLDPVKEAKERHEAFQEKAKEDVVDFKDAMLDKYDQNIISHGFVRDLYRMGTAVKLFGLSHKKEEIEEQIAKLSEETIKNIIINIQTSIDELERTKKLLERRGK